MMQGSMKLPLFFSLSLFSLMFIPTAFCAVVQTQGRTYAIQEFPMDKLIQAQIQRMKESGEWAAKMMVAKNKMRAAMQELTAVSFVTVTTTPKTFYYIPHIEVPININIDGKPTTLSMNERVNPLVSMHLDETLLFYDARDKAQRCWALHMQNEIKGIKKWILVEGNWVKESRRLKARVFVDQQERLSTQFHLTHTPAIITQVGVRLKIEEVKPCDF